MMEESKRIYVTVHTKRVVVPDSFRNLTKTLAIKKACSTRKENELFL